MANSQEPKSPRVTPGTDSEENGTGSETNGVDNP